MRKLIPLAVAVFLFALAAFAETPPSATCTAANNGAITTDSHGTTWGCVAQYKQWVVKSRTPFNTSGDENAWDSKTFNGPVTFNGLVFGTIATGNDGGFNNLIVGSNLSDGGTTGRLTSYAPIFAADAGFKNVTLSTLTATSIPSFAQKIVWSTPDPIQNDNNGGSNSRILVGPLTGVAGTISSLNCQPQERGDGGGRLYVTMSEVTDGGITFLCAYDVDDCALTSVTSAQLGFKTISKPGCPQTLSASSVYMYTFGQPTDGGSPCGLNTPILNCTTIINPP